MLVSLRLLSGGGESGRVLAADGFGIILDHRASSLWRIVMAAKSVAGDYFDVDGQLLEIKRQLRQKGGYPFDLQELQRALHLIIIGEFRPTPRRVYPEYIPLREYVITDDPFAVVRRQREEPPRSMIYQDYLWKRAFARRIAAGNV